MNLPQRKSPRRKDYDYGSAGAYFVTICSAGRQHYFGEIVDGKMILNDIGRCCYNCRNQIPNHYPFVDIDEFIVMPNHIHGIIVIGEHQGNRDDCRRDVSHTSSINHNTEDAKYCVPTKAGIQPQSGSLGSIIRGFKIGVTKYVKSGIDVPCGDIFARQGRYHDHIIRNQDSYNKIKYYIQTNPQNRESDTFNQ